MGIPFEEYEKKVKITAEAYDNANREYQTLLEQNRENERIRYEAEKFISILKERDGILDEYDFDLMKRIVEGITIDREGKALFSFYGGIEIELDI